MKDTGLVGWIRVGVSLSGSGDLGVVLSGVVLVGAMSMALTSRVNQRKKSKNSGKKKRKELKINLQKGFQGSLRRWGL